MSATGDLSKLTVPALKELCRAQGLKVGGKKSELVDRLEGAAGGASAAPSAGSSTPTSSTAAAAPSDGDILAAAAALEADLLDGLNMNDATPAVTTTAAATAPYTSSGSSAAPAQRERVNFDGPSVEQSYRRDPNDSGELTFPESELYEMLDRRVAARLSQDFGTADMIRNELRERGVNINDRTKEWRAGYTHSPDGGRGGRDGESRRGPDQYKRAIGDSSELPMDMTADEINQLLEQRSIARMTCDFDTADAIKEDLRELGVDVHDKTCEWRTDGNLDGWRRPVQNFGPNGHDYVRAQGDAADLPISEDEVNEVLRLRLEAKLKRDYSTADSLKDDLFDLGINVNDRLKEWRCDGNTDRWRSERRNEEFRHGAQDEGGRMSTRFEERAQRPKKDFGPKGHDYSRAQDDYSELAMDEEHIDEMLAERLQAKMERDFNTADNIKEDLETVGIHVEDKLKEWRADGNFEAWRNARADTFGAREGARQSLRRGEAVDSWSRAQDDRSPYNAYLEGEVLQMLSVRESFRKQGAYDRADGIRDELMGKGVKVDDRRKVWWTMAGVPESIIDDQPKGAWKDKKWQIERGFEADFGDDSDNEVDVDLVFQILEERDGFRSKKDFTNADKLKDFLRNDLKLSVNDKAKTFRVWQEENPFVGNDDMW